MSKKDKDYTIRVVPITDFKTIQDAELELDNHFITVIDHCYDLLKKGYTDIIIECVNFCKECKEHKTCLSNPENFPVNKDYKSRNKILYGEEEISDKDYKQFGIIRFSINKNQLQQLIDLKFINPMAYHNKGSTIKDFLRIYEALIPMHKKFKSIQFLGFAISEKRNDYRIEIDGIKFIGDIKIFLEIKEFNDWIAKIFSDTTYFYIKNDGFLFWYD